MSKFSVDLALVSLLIQSTRSLTDQSCFVWLSKVSRLQFPNTFGRAENVALEYNKSLKGDHGGALRFSKPLNGNPDVR